MRRSRVLSGAILTLLVIGCQTPSANTFPPAGSTPGSAGEATSVTQQVLIAAFAATGLAAAPAARDYRPPEGALLAAAPRSVLQVALPQDPNGGNVVIYAFPSEADALAAARDHAEYVETGPGRVQFPVDARHILRVVGSTVVSFWWSPGSILDPRTDAIENVLRTIGTEVPVAGT